MSCRFDSIANERFSMTILISRVKKKKKESRNRYDGEEGGGGGVHIVPVSLDAEYYDNNLN